MPSDFTAINAYLSQCQPFMAEDRSLTSYDIDTDQKVPQVFNFADLIADDKMLCGGGFQIKQEIIDPSELIYAACHMNKLAPLTSTQNITPVEFQDHMPANDAPKLLDLDNRPIGSEDLTFYDDACFSLKKEVESRTKCDDNGFYYEELSYFDEQSDAMVLRVKQDISNACTVLQISPDPINWTREHTLKWAQWALNQFPNLTHSELRMFNLEGRQLCLLCESDFQLIAPESGYSLFSQLEVWKNACILSPAISSTPPRFPQAFEYVHQYPSPAPSVSPAPSMGSVDSYSSNSMTSSFSSSQPKLNEDEYVQINGFHERVEDRDNKQTIHLWQFLRELLIHAHNYGGCIKWLDRSKGIFKIDDSVRVAKLWGKRKNRPAMNYDKLSRSIRQYYKKGIIKKTENSKRLVYQFCKPYLV